MKRNICLIVLCALMATFTSCHHHETYADKKKKERSVIQNYIHTHNVKVISEDEFIAHNFKTDVSQNEFVLFNSNGVYMQIEREGCGEKIANGETCSVLCRFDEYNLMGDSLQLSNNTLMFSSIPDKMTVTNISGTFTASFVEGQSVMFSRYGSTSVPSGWLTPLSYIKVGRPVNAEDQIAKVRIIVPHTQGHALASQGVYPCLYDITYERGRN